MIDSERQTQRIEGKAGISGEEEFLENTERSRTCI